MSNINDMTETEVDLFDLKYLEEKMVTEKSWKF